MAGAENRSNSFVSKCNSFSKNVGIMVATALAKREVIARSARLCYRVVSEDAISKESDRTRVWCLVGHVGRNLVAVGAVVGASDGAGNGAGDGTDVGDGFGAGVGGTVNDGTDADDGEEGGARDGEGADDGADDGRYDGEFGADEGVGDGCHDGIDDGAMDGTEDGVAKTYCEPEAFVHSFANTAVIMKMASLIMVLYVQAEVHTTLLPCFLACLWFFWHAFA